MNNYTEEQLIEAVKFSLSYSEVLRRLNLNITGSSHKGIKNKIKKLNIETTHFRPNSINGSDFRRKHYSELLLLNNNLKNRLEASKVRRLLIEYGKDYKCERCNNNGEWLGEKIVLEVDHINGNWKDNRPENLRFLCPNCHSLTPNFYHKKIKSDKVKEIKERTGKLKNKITKEELEKLLWEIPTTKIAENLGVSDKAISKLAKKWNLNKPNRGYWAKLK